MIETPKKTLIFDLDETLISSKTTNLKSIETHLITVKFGIYVQQVNINNNQIINAILKDNNRLAALLKGNSQKPIQHL